MSMQTKTACMEAGYAEDADDDAQSDAVTLPGRIEQLGDEAEGESGQGSGTLSPATPRDTRIERLSPRADEGASCLPGGGQSDRYIEMKDVAKEAPKEAGEGDEDDGDEDEDDDALAPYMVDRGKFDTDLEKELGAPPFNNYTLIRYMSTLPS